MITKNMIGIGVCTIFAGAWLLYSIFTKESSGITASACWTVGIILIATRKES